MNWTFEDSGLPHEASIDRLANTCLTGNGHLGLRGTLDEHRADRKAGLLVNGLYDQVPGKWREPVNAPHPMNFRVWVGPTLLDAAQTRVSHHVQGVDFRYGIQTRTTCFAVNGAEVRLSSRRWVHRAEARLLQGEWELEVDQPVTVEVRTGIDTDLWDLNGPHLEAFTPITAFPVGLGRSLGLTCRTIETQTPLTVAETVETSGPDLPESALETGPGGLWRLWKFQALPGRTYRWRKLALVDTFERLVPLASRGFEALEADHRKAWDEAWAAGDVVIDGDEEAQRALRFSLYQLLTATPVPSKDHPGLSVPARGVSGQVYKGAVFWDTEIFMVPFVLNAFPAMARNLLRYRIDTLKGALAKAAEEGHTGAFYAWESQDGGRDACTLFNVNDVFTGRPLRTFFRDKQIHISADVALALADYVRTTGDRSLLDDGGAGVILACARFFLSWMVWCPDRGRYELWDVTGPDEYHERVNNDYWTNFTAKKTLEAALEVGALLGMASEDPLMSRVSAVLTAFYLPQPDEATLVLPQFDGYPRLEDTTPAVLKTRQKHPHEYWGCGDGLARWTQVIKQADVVLALALFPADHPEPVRRANWEFYEPRTEHGSSLSACAYSMAAARLGKTEFAYRYFLKTATVDLTGDSKQYVGDLYIGGTHPAANGGAWMAVVHGFLGLERSGSTLGFDPHLPAGWKAVRLGILAGGQTLGLEVTPAAVTLTPREPFPAPLTVRAAGRSVAWWGTRPLVLPLDPKVVLPLPLKAALFDLDGVLVDTAKYHFLAWRRLAESLGIAFTEHHNEDLKGVSRTESLERILRLGNLTKTAEEKAELCEQKNRWYVDMIGGMDPSELLPGVTSYLEALRSLGVRIALGSASKNAGVILEKTGLTRYFDAVIDGTKVEKSKPDPEVFLRGARELGVDPADCVVFEDSRSGLAAARAGGMASIGIGRAEDLPEADVVVAGIADLL